MNWYGDIDKEIRDLMRANCSHVCHTGRKLNKWVKNCPVCGCENKDYDPNAQPVV